MQITWWEHLELMEHFVRRNDLWHHDDELDIWMRFAPGGETAFVLRIMPAQNDSKYRFDSVMLTPAKWTKEESEEYIYTLLRTHTMLGARVQFENFLQHEAQLDAKRALACSVVAAYIFLQGPDSSPFSYLMHRTDPDLDTLVKTPAQAVEQRPMGPEEGEPNETRL